MFLIIKLSREPLYTRDIFAYKKVNIIMETKINMPNSFMMYLEVYPFQLSPRSSGIPIIYGLTILNNSNRPIKPNTTMENNVIKRITISWSKANTFNEYNVRYLSLLNIISKSEPKRSKYDLISSFLLAVYWERA